MAPEVINEEDYDSKADIWSLGITLLELAEGLPPYAQNSTLAALRLIPKNEPPKLKEAGKWSPEFHDILFQCLQKDPTKRPTAIELLTVSYVQTFYCYINIFVASVDRNEGERIDCTKSHNYRLPTL